MGPVKLHFFACLLACLACAPTRPDQRLEALAPPCPRGQFLHEFCATFLLISVCFQEEQAEGLPCSDVSHAKHLPRACTASSTQALEQVAAPTTAKRTRHLLDKCPVPPIQSIEKKARRRRQLDRRVFIGLPSTSSFHRPTGLRLRAVVHRATHSVCVYHNPDQQRIPPLSSSLGGLGPSLANMVKACDTPPRQRADIIFNMPCMPHPAGSPALCAAVAL